MQREEKKKILELYLIQETRLNRIRQMAVLFPERADYYKEKVISGENFRKDIEEIINALDDEILSELLFQKYILGKTLEEISFTLNYSKRHIERLHIKALEKLDIASLQRLQKEL